jgi:hypothetical protein
VSTLFDHREVRSSTLPRADLWPKVWDWWGRQGFHLEQTGPYRIHGASFYGRIGLRREFDLVLDESGKGSALDLTFRARITDEGVVGGAVAAVVFWPVALVGGAVSYTEYEADSRNLMAAFWQHVGALEGRGSSPATFVPSACKGCGAALLPDWKLCPYCGAPRAGAGPS